MGDPPATGTSPDWHGQVDWSEIQRWLSEGGEPAAGDAPDALLRLGRLVDAADLLGDEQALQDAVGLANRVLARGDHSDEPTIHYFAGNAHSALWSLERARPMPDDNGWRAMWRSPHAEQTVLSYRRAVAHPSFDHLPGPRRCQIHTNLGNALSALGLALDANREYDRALALDSSFAMARGNRANAMAAFANALYDIDAQWIYYRHALADVKTALSESAGTIRLEADARAGFRRLRDSFRATLVPFGEWGGTWQPFGPSLGSTSEERAYRRWCLRHRLFLNPLNDLGPYPVAASDTLTPPTLTTEAGEGPPAHGAFNQLKQGFATSRYLLYAGIHDRSPHFSDRDVVLLDTFDFPTYGLAVERLKLAFRSLYGLFDQIAFFLNDFLRLGVPDHRVGFRTLWYEKQDPKRGVRADLLDRPNGPLVALFWVSKDLYEKRPGFLEALDPAAQRLAEIRNHIEHRYLKVHAIDPSVAAAHPDLRDRLAYSVSRSDLESHAVHLAWTARSALVYLAVAMHAEERTRRTKPDGLTLPVFPVVIDDDMKGGW